MLVSAIKIGYKIARPVIFLTNSEAAHNFFTSMGVLFGKFPAVKRTFSIILGRHYPELACRYANLSFQSPIGLSAGFDYDGKLTDFLPVLGFGFETVGTATLSVYAGNSKPRLGRLIKSRALLVNKGYKNKGIQRVVQAISLHAAFPVGLSIGATNSPNVSVPDKQIEDIARSFQIVKDEAKISYFEVNVSCPNVAGAGTLATPQSLTKLLERLKGLGITKPLFIKMPIELAWEEFKPLLDIAVAFGVTGVVIGNLVTNSSNPTLVQSEVAAAGPGNFSGKPTQQQSNDLISRTYRAFGNKLLVIGVGGVFSAADAYEKIKRGASLVQLITGLIYEGPQLVAEINRDLVQLLRKDGYANISQAMGAGNNSQPKESRIATQNTDQN